MFGAVAPTNVLAAEAPAAPPTEITAETEELQNAIDALPSLEEYDYLPFEDKEAVDGSVDDMLDVYYGALSDEERNQVDARSSSRWICMRTAMRIMRRKRSMRGS